MVSVIQVKTWRITIPAYHLAESLDSLHPRFFLFPAGLLGRG